MTDDAGGLRLYHPDATDSHAAVRVSWRPGGSALVSVWRGPGPRALREVQRLGPFGAQEVEKARAAVVEGLRAEGYEPPGVGAALRELRDPSPARRAHAARRLAQAGVRRAGAPLAELAAQPGPEISTIVEALTALGDPQAVAVARAEAGRALLSRRRAGQEALLRALGEAGAREVAAAAQVPDSVREVLDGPAPRVEAVRAALDALADDRRGPALEGLYERADPLGIEAARSFLRAVDVSAPHVWRHAKSVWKRAMLRGDAVTTGIVCWAVERRARTSAGRTVTLKSGYDGTVRTMRVFSRKTADYVRRRTWRWLRELARAAPEAYPLAAADVLAAYGAEDGADARGTPGAADCFVLHEIVRGRSPRFRLDARAMRFRPVPGARELPREEAFPELWDAAPIAYVRVLATARHPWARAFALDRLSAGHTDVLERASVEDLLGMTGSDDVRVIDLALSSLRRRFNESTIPLDLVRSLCRAAHDSVRNHGLRFLSESAARWLVSVSEAAPFLEIAEPRAREVVVRLVSSALAARIADERQAWAATLLGALEQRERAAGSHGAIAEVLLRALSDEVLALCPLSRALALVERGSEPALAVGAQVLARKPGALDVLGLSAVLALCEHDKAVVRASAHALLKEAREDVTRDPSAACALLDSTWPDSRAAGRALLSQIEPARLTLDAMCVLLDVTRPDAVAFALEVLSRAVAHLDATELAARLAQHPRVEARTAGLALARAHLRPGVVALVRAEPLVRSALLGHGTGRAARALAFELLEERALLDEPQAELAVGVLRDVLRVAGKRDRERALATLARVALAYPRVESPVWLRGAAP